MLRVTFYGVFTRRLAMSAGAKPRLSPAPSRAPSSMSPTIGRNSRERRRRSKQGPGEVADRLRVFDPGCRLRVNATQRRRANHHIRLFSSNAGQSRELFSADLRRVRVRAEHSGPQARPQRRRAQGGGSSQSASVKRLRNSSSKNKLWLWRIGLLLKRPLAFKFHPHERLVHNPIHRKIV
jgi:hypothetical protein